MADALVALVVAAAVAAVAWNLGYARGHRIAMDEAPMLRFSASDQAFFQQRVQQVKARMERLNRVTELVVERVHDPNASELDKHHANATLTQVVAAHEEVAAFLEWTQLFQYAIEHGWTKKSGVTLPVWFMGHLQLAEMSAGTEPEHG